MDLRSIARALRGEVSGNQVLAPGPEHSPKDRSLSVTLSPSAPDGFIVHYHGGHELSDLECKDYVRRKCGLGEWQKTVRERNATVYEYRNLEGELRYRKKRIGQPNGGKTFFFDPKGRGGSEPLLYGGEYLADLPEDGTVFIVEGEKKVERLRELGFTAVSLDSGAQSRWLPEHAAALRWLRIILWPDSDDPGEKYIATAARTILADNPSADIRVVRPFGPPNGAKGRDVCDWTGDAAALARLAANAAPYQSDGAERYGLESTGAIKLLRAKDVEAKNIDWIWPGWLARGKVHLTAGTKADGKTTICLSKIASITACLPWPDGNSNLLPPQNCLIWSGEDDIADTLRPRLELAGADLSRVFFLNGVKEKGKERAFDPSTDLDLVSLCAIELGNVGYILIDPIVALARTARNSHSSTDIRAALQPFADLCASIKAAGEGITHLTKGSEGLPPLDRVTGSLAWTALARIVSVTCKRKNEDATSPFALVKIASNISAGEHLIGYSIVEGEISGEIKSSRIAWNGIEEGGAEVIGEKPNKSESKRQKAEAMIERLLSRGEMESNVLIKTIKSEGISFETYKDAWEKLKGEGKVMSVKKGDIWFKMLA